MDSRTELSTREEVLIARNPADGGELGRIATTPPGAISEVVGRARTAQREWARRPWPERREALRRWWKILSAEADRFATLIRSEIGKPSNEAMAEVLISLDAIRWTVRRGGSALRDERIGPGWQRMMLIPPATLRHRPLGVIGMIGTWNYPVFLNAPVIAQALAAGNAVVWKPSELASAVGEAIQETADEAGFPEGLVSAVFGGAEVGRALVEAPLDKGVFTGGLENGRRVLESLARRGIPAVAELSGFDPAIILPDAPLESTTRSLVWGAFVGCGQTCVAVKRVYVVGDPTPWVERMGAQARALRVGDPSASMIDVGPMISEAARTRFDATIRQAVAAGATVVAGGEVRPGPGWFYGPTVLSAQDAGPESVLSGVFGPVVIVRGVADVAEAIASANAGPFGLAASVWGRDLRRAREVAGQIEAGTVTINDAVAPIGHASAPFGGTKASGFGRTHGPIGLREFVQPHVVLGRRAGGFRPQLFPYSAKLEPLFAWYRRLFHPQG